MCLHRGDENFIYLHGKERRRESLLLHTPWIPWLVIRTGLPGQCRYLDMLGNKVLEREDRWNFENKAIICINEKQGTLGPFVEALRTVVLKYKIPKQTWEEMWTVLTQQPLPVLAFQLSKNSQIIKAHFGCRCMRLEVLVFHKLTASLFGSSGCSLPPSTPRGGAALHIHTLDITYFIWHLPLPTPKIMHPGVT